MKMHSPPLRLQLADTFVLRLWGLHALGYPAPDAGLLLTPCKAVHTFFQRQALDIVFLDARGRECARLEHMRPYRVAWAARAAMAVELPAGYCRRHPDYLESIQAALQGLPLKRLNGRR